MAFVQALDDARLGSFAMSSSHVQAMVRVLRDPDSMRPDSPYLGWGPMFPRLAYEKLADLELFKAMLEAAGFTLEEMRRASTPEAAALMVRAQAAERYHEMLTPPTTWNDGDYVALGPGQKLLASERTATRAKEMAIIRGCPTPLIVPASRLKRPQS